MRFQHPFLPHLSWIPTFDRNRYIRQMPTTQLPNKTRANGIRQIARESEVAGKRLCRRGPDGKYSAGELGNG